ncbi:MAG: RNA polymerase sigma factor [Prevotella sp.]|nr:RNA polymerase sigma factor [Candidatus Equicola faecalis]
MKRISFQNDILPLKNQLYRLALRITMTKEDAEDIVQDTLIRVWNRREEWDKIDSLQAYSLTVCRNLSLDCLRKHGREHLTLEDAEAETLQSTPYKRILERDKVNVVKAIINGLPEKQRAMIQLRDLEGMSYRDIAQVMNVSEEQVKVTIFRARQAVKSKYDKIEDYGL